MNLEHMILNPVHGNHYITVEGIFIPVCQILCFAWLGYLSFTKSQQNPLSKRLVPIVWLPADV